MEHQVRAGRYLFQGVRHWERLVHLSALYDLVIMDACPSSCFSTPRMYLVQSMRPKAHSDLSQQVERILSGSNATISEFMGNVDDMLRKQGIEVEDIEGRPKSISSIRAKQAPSKSGAPSKVSFIPLYHHLLLRPASVNIITQ